MSTGLRRLLCPSQTVVADAPANLEHFFRPTSGRWLWNEQYQLSLHTRKLDVKALKDVVARAMGAETRVGNICVIIAPYEVLNRY
jgi:hypothetical protein